MSRESQFIVGPDGKPVLLRDGECPRCGASKEKRVGGGLGAPRSFCSVCAHEFPGEE